MAKSLTIEEESGVITGTRHRHNGYYAGDFTHVPFRELHGLATLQRTQSRASYWLGRTHAALGRSAAARLDYVEAARFGGTFHVS